MSEQDGSEQIGSAQDAAPAATSPTPGQRRISGLLIASLIVILLGAIPNRILPLPFIGPVGGLILAFVAKKRMKTNPLLIGPRFALFCIIAALLALPWNGYLAYVTYNPQMMGKAVADKYVPLIQGLLTRDYPKAYAVMDESYRQGVTLEEFTARVSGLFPGTEPIPAEDVTLSFREQEMGEELNQEFERLSKGEVTELNFVFPWRIVHGENEALCDMEFWVRRIAWGEYEAKVVGIRLLNPDPAEATETSPSKGTSADEDQPK